MPSRRIANKADPETVLARTALRLLEKEEWRQLTLAAIARAAKLPLREVLTLAGSKTGIAGLVFRMLASETATRYGATWGRKPCARSSKPSPGLWNSICRPTHHDPNARR